MDKRNWRVNKINEILGLPELNPGVLPLHVIVELRERLSAIDEVGAVILYGSLVRGEATSTSDLDIMVVPTRSGITEKTRKKVQRVLSAIETEFKLKNPFSLNIFTGKEDSHFLWEVVNDGVVLLSKVEMAINDLKNTKPYALISYSFNKLDEKSKKYIQRYLFESKKGVQIDRRNRQEYVSRGVILVSVERAKKVTKLFDEIGVEYSLIKIWR